VLAAIGASYAAAETGVIGPSTGIQPTGRLLDPVGKMTQLGNFPTGGALTTNGRFLWTLSTGRDHNDIRIVRVASNRRCRLHGKGKPAHRRLKKCKKRAKKKVGKVVQDIPMPGLSGGIAMAPDGRTAYVSGIEDSPYTDQTLPNAPGAGGDVVHVFNYSPKNGKATETKLFPVPPPDGAPSEQSFPPTSTKASWPRDIAVSPNGKTLLVALNLADYAAIIDTKSGNTRYAKVGPYPYGAGITRDGADGLVTSEVDGTVSVVDLSSGITSKTIQVGPHLSHPESIAMDPKRDRAYVAVTNQDLIAVINTKNFSVERTLSVERPQGTGTTPSYLSVTSDGCDLLSADSGEDAVAVFALGSNRGCDAGAKAKPKKHHKAHASGAAAAKAGHKSRKRHAKPFELIGRIPVGSYPTVAVAGPKHKTLAWVSARGIGVGPNTNGPNPNSPNDSDNNINSFQYLPSIVQGSSGILAFPSDKKIRKLTPQVDKQIVPTNSQVAPANTPISPGGPIKHVFYIVRENRTYDQVLGDDSRGDGDPNLTLFGGNITPNLHALAQRFPLLDHVYANSEASIDGHYWTAAGAVSDYVVKNWPQNYSGRGRPYDFGAYVISNPPTGYIFSRMLDAGISFYNYGEGLAGLNPLPDRNRTDAETVQNAQILSPTRSDIQLNGGCYDGDISIFDGPVIGAKVYNVYDSSLPPGAPLSDHSRFDCFNTRFQAQLTAGSVPAFNYISLPLDHTQGVSPGKRTPNADIADNDWALGQFVDAISHSSIWDSSLILVMEDDSQDGADHVDAHRMPALAISPYTQQGAVVHNRYDQLSFLRTAEIITGLKPTNLAEALAVPLYDAMTPDAQNSAPYDAIVPGLDMTATNPNTAANRKASAGLNLEAADQVPQQRLDAILWHYRHGFDSAPPPPGPNASTTDTAERDESADNPIGNPESYARQLKKVIRHERRQLRHRHRRH
jgi:DNA-binding beta-propeller fold protein YncE